MSLSRIPSGWLFSLGCVVALLIVAGAWLRRAEREGGPGPERWFVPGPLGHEPGKGTLPLGSDAYASRFIYGLDSPAAREWARRNKLTDSLNFSHHLAQVFPPTLFAAHPEYFPWMNGQRERPAENSQSWNPDLGRADVAAHAAAAAREAFVKEPGRVSFALGVNDGLVFGDSPETLAAVTPMRWFRGRPDFSNLVFGFMNRAAADLERTHPDKYLGTLAYYWAENAPDFPVHPQVVPFLTADRSQGYDAVFWREELALQAQWAKAGPRRLGLYDYLFGAGFIVPRIHPHLIADSLRHARAAGFTDYFCEATPNWGIDGPMTWLVAQLLADPGQNVDVLLGEYYERYFQESAIPMRRLFERCEALWMNQPGHSYWLKHYRNDSQADLFPSNVVAELRILLTEAQRLARSEKVRARVALVSESFGVTERFVAFHEARGRLSQQTVAGTLTGEAGWAALRTYLDKRSEFLSYSRALTRREPLAFHAILYDDFLRHDPTFAAAILLQETAEGDPDGRALQKAASGSAKLSSLRETGVVDGQAWLLAKARGQITELLPDGGMEGPLRPGKRIAGLVYGLDSPSSWQSKAEPAQYHVGSVQKASAHNGQAGLRISGAVNTTVYQWYPASVGRLYVSSVHARGQVTSSNAVLLTLGWLDGKGQLLGSSMAARLPDGKWPNWVQLQQGARAPAGAVWVGIGVTLQNQMKGDWAEFDDFSLVDAGLEMVR